MSEIDMLKESLTRILRPIIFEAVREAFAEQRKKPTPKRYYTPVEAQNRLKISRATFYRHVSQGKIEILKIGSNICNLGQMKGSPKKQTPLESFLKGFLEVPGALSNG